MNHSLFSADRGTHRKIVAVALAGSLLLVLGAISARAPRTDEAGARVEAGLVIRAGKPTLAAATDTVRLR